MSYLVSASMSDFEIDADFLDHALKDVNVEELEFVIDQLEGGHGQESLNSTTTSTTTNTSTTRDNQSYQAKQHNDIYRNQRSAQQYQKHTNSRIQPDDFHGVRAGESEKTGASSSSMDSCRVCGNIKLVARCYGYPLCCNCASFVRSVVKMDFNLTCHRGGKCDISHKEFVKKCGACRFNAMLKLNITHPDWIRYKETTDYKTTKRHDEGTTHCELARLAIPVTPEPTPRVVEETDNASKCRVCGNTNLVARCYGYPLCCNCSKFVGSVVKMDFNLTCNRGGNCDISHKEFVKKCGACRFNAMLKLDIAHPDWIRYKESTNHRTKRHNDEMTTHSGPERVATPVTPTRKVVEGNDNTPKCQVCGNTNLVARCYGYPLCVNCSKFVGSVAKMDFNLTCNRGGNCDISHKEFVKKCGACRFNAMLKLDIAHPDWIRYKKSTNYKKTKRHDDRTTHCDPARVAIPVTREPTPRVVGAPKCQICGSYRLVVRSVRPKGSFFYCRACMQYLLSSSKTGFKQECATGLYDCQVMHLGQGRASCAGCRIRKAISLGYDHPKLADSVHKHCLGTLFTEPTSPDNLPECPQSPLPPPSPPAQTIEDLAAADNDSNNSKHQHRGPIVQTIEVMCAEDLEQAQDEYGLPANGDRRFSRWLYGEMREFSAGSGARKSESAEVHPEPVVKVKVFSNDLTSLGTRFLTQGLSRSCRPPVEEIVAPILDVRHRAGDKTATAAAAVVEVEEEAVPRGARKQKKPKVTLTLKTHRTIIDRRPLLKRLKISSSPRRDRQDLEEVSTTSLIGPGEDCDASDDELDDNDDDGYQEVIEIDC